MDTNLDFFLKYCNVWRPAALIAAAELNIATILGDETKSYHELASQTGAQSDWVYRILRMLAVDGIFAEEEHGMFRNTKMSHFLRADIPGSARSMISLLSSSYFHDSFTQLSKVALTGKTGPQILGRPPFYVHLQEDPQENAIFEDAIATMADPANEAIASGYPFPAGARVVDVAGGQGNLLRTIQKMHPTIKATLVDLPAVVEQVKVRDAGSLELIARNIFRDQLPEADYYIFRDFYHCFDDNDCRAIAANCRRSMLKGSKMLIIEQPFDTALAAGVDLIMGVVFGGKQRKDEEWENLLSPLVLSRRFETKSPFIIWEFSLSEP